MGGEKGRAVGWSERTCVWMERTDRESEWVGPWVPYRGRVGGSVPAGIDRGRQTHHHGPPSVKLCPPQEAHQQVSGQSDEKAGDDIEEGAGQGVLTVVASNSVPSIGSSKQATVPSPEASQSY